MPAAADANEPVFYHADGSARSLGEVYNRFAARFGGGTVTGGGAVSPATTTTPAPASSYAAAASAYGLGAMGGFASRMATAAGAPSVPTASADVTAGATAMGAGASAADRASLYEMLVLSQLSATQALAEQPPQKTTGT